MVNTVADSAFQDSGLPEQRVKDFGYIELCRRGELPRLKNIKSPELYALCERVAEVKGKHPAGLKDVTGRNIDYGLKKR